MKEHLEGLKLGGRAMTKNEIKIKELQQRIDKAIEYIKQNIDNTGWLEIGGNCVKELLEILEGNNEKD